MLVLVHGVAGSSSAVWRPVVATLARHFEVVQLDLLGYGRSPKPSIEYTPLAHAAAIHDTLKAHDVRPPFVIAGLLQGAADRWTDVDQIRAVLAGRTNCHLTLLPNIDHNAVVFAPEVTADWIIDATGAKAATSRPEAQTNEQRELVQ